RYGTCWPDSGPLLACFAFTLASDIRRPDFSQASGPPMQTIERPAQPTRVSSVRRFVTRRGRELPFTSMGFGSAPLGNYLRPLAEDDCDATLQAAWDAGMRYFDTAPFYGFGLSEQRIGRLLKKVDRRDYVISTKVGRLFEPCAPDEVNSPFFID